MRHLAARHEMTYLSFADPSAPPARPRRDARGLRPSRDGAAARGRRRASPRFYLQAAATPRSTRCPTRLRRTARAEYRARRSRGCSTRSRYDALVCDFLVPAVNLPRPGAVPVGALHAQRGGRDSGAATPRPTAARLAPRPAALAVAADAALRRAHPLGASTRVLAVSEADRDTFARLYAGRLRARSEVIPTGVDTEYFAPAPTSPVDPFRLVFTGSMDWLPNEDAVLYFCQRDPAAHPPRRAARLARRSSGRNPTPAVLPPRRSRCPASRSRGAWTTCGRTWRRAALSIVPLRIGGGTRLKIYEAMAMGRPVVSTSDRRRGAAAGTRARHGDRRRSRRLRPRGADAAVATRQGGSAMADAARASRGRAVRLVAPWPARSERRRRDGGAPASDAGPGASLASRSLVRRQVRS